ncbi:MAG: tRNA 2-thiouridine(34) synthase MnmA [Lachnospiraceae bacterium]|nr:tRNA 2-thiouridine(34) synthase MnmA [Lachnospiraceae bacterium]
MSKIVVGMSGGVDSAVAAYLLKEQGHEVVGVTLRTWLDAETEVSKCCEIDDAREISRKLGIPYHVHNVGADFRKYVTEPFVAEYLAGRTPNPCIECNPHVKWEGMIYTTHLFHADYVATGHYANIVQLPNGRYTVKQATAPGKDQTYMLYKLSQEQLAKTIMPLGTYSKDEVREIARQAGIPVAEKADSQEICFVEDGHYADYIRDHANDGTIADESNANNTNSKVDVLGEGNFVDTDGNILGKHKGIIHYTIGQRKGLGIALGHPIFVKEIRPETNDVVLSEEDAIFTKEAVCKDVHYMSIPDLKVGEEIPARVKIRYRHAGESAVLRRDGDGVRIYFENAVRAATPGQSAVFYDDDNCVIGGGIII